LWRVWRRRIFGEETYGTRTKSLKCDAKPIPKPVKDDVKPSLSRVELAEIIKPILISDEYLDPLYDDLNTPGYIANLHKLYEKSQKGDLRDKEIFTSACNFIGLLNENKKEWESFKKVKINISEDEILAKIEERNIARENKNYKEADKIRNHLLDKGVLIEDKDGKTSWKIKWTKINFIYLILH